ncbi:MAG: hypothetical protein LC679_16740 [Intrasporangiaceae bacterium]|nr:hypothetical protein [Intrasporangiaceae bacterium]
MLVDEAERDPVLAQHVIPDARLLTVPAAGHMVLIEQPQIGCRRKGSPGRWALLRSSRRR